MAIGPRRQNKAAEVAPNVAWRFGPIAALLVGILLAVLFLPSSLNLPQANPNEIAEYAPVPPNSNQAPPGGNIGSLGLAGSSTLTEDTSLASSSGGSNSSGYQSLPANLRCVMIDGQAHQTEDPLSPPCVPYFNGDNFGSTYEGVSGNEIRVILYMEGGDGGSSAATGDYCYSNTGESAARPTDTYYDFDLPASKSSSDQANHPESSNDYAPEVRDLVNYINTHYQFYKRHIHLRLWFGRQPTNWNGGAAGGNHCPTAGDRIADAEEEYQAFHPFAVINASSSNPDAYSNWMAQHGVFNFLSMSPIVVEAKLGYPQSFYQSYPGLVWSYLPSMENYAAWMGDLICQKIVKPGIVTYSGDPTKIGQKRSYGLVEGNDPNHPQYGQFAHLLMQHLEACGVPANIPTEQIPNAGYDIDETGVRHDTNPNDQTYAVNAMANMKAQGVTTVIWAGGSDDLTTKGAEENQFYPEWIVTGDRSIETPNDAQVQDPQEWSHVFIGTSVERFPDRYNQECYLAYADTDPNAQAPGQFQANAACDFYPDFRLLATGVQIAGPRLDPSNIDQGFHAIPKESSNNPYEVTCYFNPGDYTCIKDAQVEWYDKSSVDPDGNTGCWRETGGGARYLEGNWPNPGVDITKMQDTTNDPCNDYHF